MPGPGGGARGGGGGRGFGGGGSHGGGFGGGFGGGGRGFGGGHHHHHGPYYHRPRYYGGFWGPRRYYGYGGGGCLGGLLGILLLPIILVLFAGLLLLTTFSSAFNSVMTGGEIYYDENAFQTYADEQYAKYFSDLEDYEDALLVVFVVEDETYYDYAYIAWPGHNLDKDIRDMFGAHGTEFGNAVESSAINSSSYKYALSSGIADIMSEMKDQIVDLQLENNLTCKHDYSTYKSHVVNNTELTVSPNTVNSALVSFTEATGIPVIVIVEDASAVLPQDFDYFSVFLAIVFIVIAIVLIVKILKNRKNNGGNDNNNYNNGNYNDNNNYNNGNYNNNYNNGNYNNGGGYYNGGR